MLQNMSCKTKQTSEVIFFNLPTFCFWLCYINTHQYGSQYTYVLSRYIHTKLHLQKLNWKKTLNLRTLGDSTNIEKHNAVPLWIAVTAVFLIRCDMCYNYKTAVHLTMSLLNFTYRTIAKMIKNILLSDNLKELQSVMTD